MKPIQIGTILNEDKETTAIYKKYKDYFEVDECMFLWSFINYERTKIIFLKKTLLCGINKKYKPHKLEKYIGPKNQRLILGVCGGHMWG